MSDRHDKIIEALVEITITLKDVESLLENIDKSSEAAWNSWLYKRDKVLAKVKKCLKP